MKYAIISIGTVIVVIIAGLWIIGATAGDSTTAAPSRPPSTTSTPATPSPSTTEPSSTPAPSTSTVDPCVAAVSDMAAAPDSSSWLTAMDRALTVCGTAGRFVEVVDATPGATGDAAGADALLGDVCLDLFPDSPVCQDFTG